jgi:hypothetical protein
MSYIYFIYYSLFFKKKKKGKKKMVIYNKNIILISIDTCYINATLKCMRAIPELKEQLKK